MVFVWLFHDPQSTVKIVPWLVVMIKTELLGVEYGGIIGGTGNYTLDLVRWLMKSTCPKMY